jgi:threonine/homoserine/homoserine lactone efflux protein
MGNWPALLIAPTLALTNLSITYALVTPACTRQSMLAPNAVSAVVLAVCAWLSWAAWRNWRAGRGQGREAARDRVPDRPPFVALVAALVGALSCLAVVAQWFPQWVLSPCAA